MSPGQGERCQPGAGGSDRAAKAAASTSARGPSCPLGLAPKPEAWVPPVRPWRLASCCPSAGARRVSLCPGPLRGRPRTAVTHTAPRKFWGRPHPAHPGVSLLVGLTPGFRGFAVTAAVGPAVTDVVESGVGGVPLLGCPGPKPPRAPFSVVRFLSAESEKARRALRGRPVTSWAPGRSFPPARGRSVHPPDAFSRSLSATSSAGRALGAISEVTACHRLPEVVRRFSSPRPLDNAHRPREAFRAWGSRSRFLPRPRPVVSASLSHPHGAAPPRGPLPAGRFPPALGPPRQVRFLSPRCWHCHSRDGLRGGSTQAAVSPEQRRVALT